MVTTLISTSATDGFSWTSREVCAGREGELCPTSTLLHALHNFICLCLTFYLVFLFCFSLVDLWLTFLSRCRTCCSGAAGELLLALCPEACATCRRPEYFSLQMTNLLLPTGTGSCGKKPPSVSSQCCCELCESGELQTPGWCSNCWTFPSVNRAGVRRCVRRLGDHLGSCARVLCALCALHSSGAGRDVPGHHLGEQHGFYRHHQVFQRYSSCSVGQDL